MRRKPSRVPVGAPRKEVMGHRRAWPVSKERGTAKGPSVAMYGNIQMVYGAIRVDHGIMWEGWRRVCMLG